MTEATLEVTRQKPLWATGRRKSAVARVRVVPGETKTCSKLRNTDVESH